MPVMPKQLGILERAEASREYAIMGQILKFIPPDTVFDPETAAMLGAVFDRAIAALDLDGQPEVVRETLAKRIIALAAKGERDPNHIYKTILGALGAMCAAEAVREFSLPRLG